MLSNLQQRCKVFRYNFSCVRLVSNFQKHLCIGPIHIHCKCLILKQIFEEEDKKQDNILILSLKYSFMYWSRLGFTNFMQNKLNKQSIKQTQVCTRSILDVHIPSKEIKITFHIGVCCNVPLHISTAYKNSEECLKQSR